MSKCAGSPPLTLSKNQRGGSVMNGMVVLADACSLVPSAKRGVSVAGVWVRQPIEAKPI